MLTGTGEAGATITFTDTVSGDSTVLGSTTVDSSGVWSYQATSITSGSHSITARQTDMAGNLSSASSAFTFTVDTTLMGLPALASASDSGTLRDAITNQTAPAFTGVAVTKGGTVQVYDVTTLLGSTTSDANTGVWTFTPANSLSSGSHTITAKDVSANKTSSAFALTIDTTAAAPSITAPTASSKAAPTISGTGAEANASVTLTAKANDGTTQTFTTTANASGAWVINTASTANSQVALVANKIWTFSATQADAAGNQSAVSAAQTVNYDTTIATPTITNLADNASTANKVTLLGTAEASTVLGNVTVQVYDGSGYLGSTTTDYTGGWVFTTPSLSAGAHTLKVEQVDAEGNLSAQASKAITVGTALTAPQLTAIDGLQIATIAGGTNRLGATMPITAAGGSAVSFFAKLDETGGFQQMLAGANSYELYYNNSALTLWANNGGNAVSFTADTNWHHYAIVHDGLGNANVYVDGVLKLAKTGDSATGFTSVYLTFGNHGSQSRSINGSMRDIKVFDVSLTPTQVQNLYNGQATGQESQLKAAYALMGNTTATSTIPTSPALTVTGTMTAHATDSGILGDSITNSTQPILVGQATAGTSVEIWDTFNSVTSKLTTVTADSTGAWSANLLGQAAGVHSYVAKQLNADLSVASTSAATALTIDTTAPSAPGTPVLAAGSDTGTSGDNITSKNTPTLSGTADANAWVTVYQAGSVIGKVKALANGTWSFAVDKAMADGTHALTVKQEDAAGNLSAASSALNLTIDTTAAAPSYLTTMIDEAFTSNTTTGTLGTGATSLAVSGGKINTTGAYTVISYNTAMVVGETYFMSFDYTKSSGGSLRVKASSVADIGNTKLIQTLASSGTISGSFTADGSILSIAAQNGTFSGTLDNIRLYRVNAAPSSVASQPVVTGLGEAGAVVSVYNNASLLGTATANSIGVWSYQATGITSGSHSITTQQTDTAGNVSPTGANRYFTIGAPPVVIDLNRDGAIGYSQVLMDVNGDGQLDHSAWVGPSDGVLVWDQHHDGMVHSPSQFVFATQAGQTDLQGLAAQFDSNQDKVFDAQDALFGEFAVWQDSNQNGVSDAGELRSLAELGIQSLALQSDGVQRQPASGVNEAGQTTATTIDGSPLLVADASFDFTSLTSVAVSSAVGGQVDLASDTRANVLQLTLQDLLALPTETLFDATNTSLLSGTPLQPAQHQLMVTGDSNDVVKLDPSLLTDTHTVVRHNDHSYQVYTVDSAHTQLLIDENIVHAGRVL